MYGLVVAGYALVSALPLLLDTSSRAVSVPYRAVVALIGVWLIVRALQRRALYAGLFWAPFGLFWLLYSLRLLLDIQIMPKALQGSLTDYVIFAFGICLIPAIAFMQTPGTATIRRAYQFVLAMTAAACLTTLLLSVRAILSGDALAAWFTIGRLGTDTLNPILLGHLGVTLAILSFVGLFRLFAVPAIPRLLLAALAALGLVTAAVAASRGPLVALAAVVGIMALSARSARQRLRALIAIILIGGIGYPTAVLVEERLGFGIITRTITAGGDLDESGGHRFILVRDAWRQFMNEPVIGSSLEERNSGSYPHNPVVESFMATGVFGGLAFLALVAGSLRSGVWLLRNAPHHGWVALLHVQALVGASFSGSLWASDFMWCFTAAVLATRWGLARSARPAPIPMTWHRVPQTS
jgi:hypothetical protein